MLSQNHIDLLKNEFADEIEFLQDFPISKYCTLHAGGNAKLFCRVNTSEVLEKLLKFLLKNQIEFRVLGAISNVLVSDKGYGGLIIQNKSQEIEILPTPDNFHFLEKPITARLHQKHSHEFFSIDGLDYDHSVYPPQLVRLATGITLVKAFHQLLAYNIVGLEMFAGIPGTIGGAIYTNAHGGTRFIGGLVYQAQCLDDSGNKLTLTHDQFDFDYDYSSLHEKMYYVLNADLVLRIGDTQKAKEIAKEWARRKSLQPQLSLGSVFQNLSDKDMNLHNLPTSSAGYVIDKVLGLRGNLQVGQMIVSSENANIVKNLGGGTASDYYALVQKIKKIALEKSGIILKEEIYYLGDFE